MSAPTSPPGSGAVRAALFALTMLPATSIAGHFPMYYTWPQPDGPGSDITLTYSFSNLFDGSIRQFGSGDPFDPQVLRAAFTRAMQDYTDHLPIHFVEVPDNGGPLPETGEYDPTGLADVRIGQVAHIEGANAYAYFPFDQQDDTPSGLAGDIVFNAERFGFDWTETIFYGVAQHELGHTLGMGHYVDGDPPNDGGTLTADSEYTGVVFPLSVEMVEALQGAYGAGTGSVTPLSAIPLPAASLLFASALVSLVTGSLRRRPRS